MIGPDREARRALYRAVRKPLWRGEVDAALEYLEVHRPQAKNVARLNEHSDSGSGGVSSRTH